MKAETTIEVAKPQPGFSPRPTTRRHTRIAGEEESPSPKPESPSPSENGRLRILRFKGTSPAE